MIDELISPVADWIARRSARKQRDSSLWDAGLWGAEVDPDGRLQFDGVDMCAAVTEHESPTMLVSHSRLQHDTRQFITAAEDAFDDVFVAFSYKTNSVSGVLAQIHENGMGAEVISPYELWLAARLGVPGEQIIVNGVNKTRAFLEHAAALDVFTINIDSAVELPMLIKIAEKNKRPINVGLRLRVDPGSHFGLDLQSGEALRVAAEIRDAPDLLTFTGLQFHALADNEDPGKHVERIRTALRFAVQIKFELGMATPNLDIGGGFTVPTVAVASRWQYARQRLFKVPPDASRPERKRPVSDYLRSVAVAFTDFCRSADLDVPRLILEPGRIITSQSHVLLTQVHSLKTKLDGRSYALTDAGRILTSQPCDYEYHQIFVANRMNDEPARRYDLTGRLCTTADWLAHNRYLPRISAGDVLAIMDAGAYFTSYATNFAFPRPEIVMARDGEVTVLRKRETYDHLTAMDQAQDVG